MAAPVIVRRPKHDTTPVITVVVVVVLILAGVLMWQNSRAQDRLTTLRSGQTTGLAQRTDQQQLTCVLWAILRDTRSAELTPAMRKSADKICAGVPTPSPSPSASR